MKVTFSARSVRGTLQAVTGLGLFLLLTSSIAQAQLTKFVVQNGAAAPALDNLRLELAQQLGFFRDEGIDVEIRYGRGAALAAQMVGNGQADIGVITYEPPIIGYEKGLRGKFIYSTTSTVIYYVGLPAESAIHGVEDLRGKKIGVASLGSAAVTVTNAMLRSAGVQPSEVTFLPVGAGDLASAALRSGNVDALALWDGAYAAMESAGMKLRFLHYAKLAGGGNAGLFVSDQLLSEKRDALKRFTRAWTKATVFALANPDAAMQIFWKVHPGTRPLGDDADALRKGGIQMQFVLRTFQTDDLPVKKYGYISPEHFQRYVDVLFDEGLITKKPPVDALITDEFIDFANDFDHSAVQQMAQQYKVR